jgi:hypothetical protein
VNNKQKVYKKLDFWEVRPLKKKSMRHLKKKVWEHRIRNNVIICCESKYGPSCVDETGS